VLRGIAGFGAHSRIHTARLERLSVDLPIIIEIVDTIERIEAFLPIVDSAITEGLATIERVHIRFYRAGNRTPAGA
jgi:PII-like signaling protein